MVYVDGGHDLRTLKIDTKNAFKMLSPNSLSCIAWHDYNNTNYPHLTKYIDDISTKYDIYHIEETMVCFYLNNAGVLINNLERKMELKTMQMGSNINI